MANLETLASCKQLECPIGTSGKCLEGLDSTTCSHFYWDEESDLAEVQEVLAQSQVNMESLYSGDEFSVKELSMITNHYRANVIIIIGESESGKTTILSSIFDLFQTGQLKKYKFSGSKTMIGFEKRCHLSRKSSQAQVPETDKTVSREFSFLHLAFKEGDEKKACHLLLSDISGERFQLAKDSSESMIELDLMAKADHLLVLIDGKKLGNKFKRTGAINNALMFVQRALDVGLISVDRRLVVAISKYDLLVSVQTFDIDKHIKTPFLARFGQRVKEIEFVELAVRPTELSSKYTFGFGVLNLLHEWKQKRNLNTKTACHVSPGFRFIDNFVVKDE